MAIGLATVGACSSHSSAKPTTTSTPPAVSQPSAPVPDQAPDATDLTAPLTAKIGETFNVTLTDSDNVIARADVTVNKMRDLGSSYLDPTYGGDKQFADHAARGRYVVFTITYADTAGAFDYNEFDWTVRMPDGQEYDQPGFVQSSTDAFGQSLNSGTLHKGHRAKGVISFDIPRTHGLLVYNADGGSGYGQEVDVKF